MPSEKTPRSFSAKATKPKLSRTPAAAKRSQCGHSAPAQAAEAVPPDFRILDRLWAWLFDWEQDLNAQHRSDFLAWHTEYVRRYNSWLKQQPRRKSTTGRIHHEPLKMPMSLRQLVERSFAKDRNESAWEQTRSWILGSDHVAPPAQAERERRWEQHRRRLRLKATLEIRWLSYDDASKYLNHSTKDGFKKMLSDHMSLKIPCMTSWASRLGVDPDWLESGAGPAPSWFTGYGTHLNKNITIDRTQIGQPSQFIVAWHAFLATPNDARIPKILAAVGDVPRTISEWQNGTLLLSLQDGQVKNIAGILDTPFVHDSWRQQLEGTIQQRGELQSAPIPSSFKSFRI